MRETAQRLTNDVRAGWRGAPTAPPPAQPPTDATDAPQDDLTDE